MVTYATKTDKTPRNRLDFVDWKSYTDLHQAYWLMGLGLYFPVPDISKRWKFDEEFGRQRLAGVNPCFVQLLEPENYKYLKSIGFSESLITELLRSKGGRSFNGDFAGEMSRKKLYFINYRVLLKDWRSKFNEKPETEEGAQKYCASPVALFWSSPNLAFIPLAISLEESDPQPYTFKDREEDWLLAKIYFGSAESTIHQLYTHYVRSHANSEVFAIAARRNLFSAHPIFKLLKPHLRYTIAINAKARAKLICANGHFENAFYSGKYSMEFGQDVYKKHYNWKDQSLKRDLKNRNVLDPNALPNYPYRDDGLLIWQAIKNMVNSYIDVYYRTDQQVKDDSELKNWWTDATEKGHYKKEFPPLNSKKALQKALRRIIWSATGHHACINFPQYEFTSYSLNMPPHMREGPGPRGVATEETVMRSIPNLLTSCLAIAVTKTLSSYAEKGEEEYLGSPKEQLVFDSAALRVLNNFKQELKDIEAQLVETDRIRSAITGVKYPWLHPSRITNSVAV
eukprot:TRINITY_DN18583_c0_g1_i1.p1 TRINITY_DN18583_c0_g1~~TRINITY_DN18583_c0_g1_i1.p1  ORF type:complete len:511 (+),score=85.20 TRINITY_DN18583_c0_g1_i1:767-2299(+)